MKEADTRFSSAAHEELDDALGLSLRQRKPPSAERGSLEQSLSIGLILAATQRASQVEGLTQRLGRLLVQSRIGGGGMGVVYKAYDPELRRNVAVKLLRDHIRDDERKLIATEARALAQLNHPNVVTIYDVVDDGQEVYFVMEYVPGVCLAEWLTVHPSAPWREVAAIFGQAGEGLAAAHERGVIHGDFKPHNVLVGEDERARVADFGLARGDFNQGTERSGGTPHFMAPEVRSGGRSTTKSDQYSFCVALSDALANRTVPERVGRILRKGLDSDPDRRHTDMRALVGELERVAKTDRGPSHELLANRVERLWLRGVFERSLAGHPPAPLTLRSRPSAVTPPWQDWSPASQRATYASSEIKELMEQSYNALLILGEPGAGKSTVLLSLCRELLNQAADDVDAPAPIVLSLASYKPDPKHQDPAQEVSRWIIDEVVAKYGIARPVIEQWLREASVAVLLDGLDETEADLREQAVQAINAFHLAVPVPIAVSCRDAEYEAQKTKLRFGAAVEIEPLSEESARLIWRRHTRVDTEPRSDIDVRNPLLLTLLASGDRDQRGARTEGWDQAYTHYVQRAFERCMSDEESDELKAQLSFLATTMKRLNVSDLWLEQLRSAWLPGRAARIACYLAGVLAVLLFGFGFTFAQVPVTGMPPISALTFALGSSLGSFAYTLGRIRPVEQLRWSWRRAVRLLPVTTFFSLTVGLIEGLRVNFASNMVGALIGGAVLSIAFGLEASERPAKVEANAGIRRSFRYAWLTSLSFAVPSGLFFGLIVNPLITGPLMQTQEHETGRALVIGVAIGLFGFTALFLIYGGFAVIMHWTIRLFLAWMTPLPLDLTRMLDRAVELDFLRRVGGGYVFRHRTLLDYFASDRHFS